MCDRDPSTLLSSTFRFAYPTLAAWPADPSLKEAASRSASWPLPCCSLYLGVPLPTPPGRTDIPVPLNSLASFYLSPSKMLYSSLIYFTYFSSSLITDCAPPRPWAGSGGVLCFARHWCIPWNTDVSTS